MLPESMWGEVPFPEVCVAGCEGDFRDKAHEAIRWFKQATGRWPNYCGVSLEQVERLEDAYGVPGIEHVSHIAKGTIPLLFVE